MKFPLALGRQLLSLIIQTSVQAGGTVDLVIDETLERRWGAKISKRRHYLGRPRVVGKRLLSVEHVLHNPKTVWSRITLDCYGQGKRDVEICTATALWYWIWPDFGG